MNALTATHLDGPKLIGWLRDRGAIRGGNLKDQVGTRWNCQVRRWEKGSAIYASTADEFLMSLDVALGEVPDDIYRDDPSKNAPAISAEEMARIVALRSEGRSFYAIGKQLGRDHKTVRRQLSKVGIA